MEIQCSSEFIIVPVVEGSTHGCIIPVQQLIKRTFLIIIFCVSLKVSIVNINSMKPKTSHTAIIWSTIKGL